jgi:NAD(P)-dependent dehydrogenase (short-subunit alcohol dehydrogenase family)
MSTNILISGASSGFGAMTARALADSGHTVYAGIRNLIGGNAKAAAAAADYSREYGVDLPAVELEVSNQASVDAAVAKIFSEVSRLDVVVHNAGRARAGRSLHRRADRSGLRHERAAGIREDRPANSHSPGRLGGPTNVSR